MARDLILASRSPRRLEALAALGLRFAAEASPVETELPPPADATDPVPIAAAKARDVAVRHPEEIVLAGDTIVVLGRAALGKPADPAEAEAMLRTLRGREHVVRTGLAVCAAGHRNPVRSPQSEVRSHGDQAGAGTECRAQREPNMDVAEVACPLLMRVYADAEVHAYVASGEPLDCAGAYDVHRRGGALVAEVRGCFSTVVGFPIVQAAAMLRAAGVDVPTDPAQVCTDLYGRPCLALRPETARACQTPAASDPMGRLWRPAAPAGA